MLRGADLPTTTILFIDPNDTERKVFVEELKRRSPDYRILEATDGESGLALYRFFQQIDCVILVLELPDCSGFSVLVDLIPIARRRRAAGRATDRYAGTVVVRAHTPQRHQCGRGRLRQQKCPSDLGLVSS